MTATDQGSNVASGVVSSSLDDIAAKVRADNHTYGERLKVASRVAKSCLVLAGASLAGAAQFIPTEHATLGRVFGFVGVALALTGGLWNLFVDDSVPNALQNAHNAIDRAKAAEDAHKKAEAVAQSKAAELETKEREFQSERESFDQNEQFLSDLYATSLLMNSKVVSEISSSDFDEAKSCQNVLDTAVRQIHGLLEFEGGEDWTLSVYQAVIDSGKVHLAHIAGQRADRSDEKREHRNWGIGEGVAGHAFQTGKELIIRNAYDSKSAGWIHVPDRLRREDDNVKYVSFAAIPVMIPSQSEPWGIVVATSDIENRFETDDEGNGDGGVEPLRMIAAQIALLATTAYVKSRSTKRAEGEKDNAAKTPPNPKRNQASSLTVA